MAEISKIKLADGSIVELKDAKARELINSRAVGQPTDDGGEIFNDYTNNTAGEFAHAEGQHTAALGVASHAEGKSEMSIADGEVGVGTINGWYAEKVEGQENTYSIGAYSEGPPIGTEFWAEEGGIATIISINERVVDMGTGETWTEYDSYVTDKPVFIYRLYGSEPYAIIHTIGAKGDYSHVEGYNTLAKGIGSHAEGLETQAIGNYSHTEGGSTKTQGRFSHAEGRQNSALGFASHAEGGDGYYAMGYESDEPSNWGDGNEAFGSFSHVEGNNTQAGSLIDENGWAAHAEGMGSVAIGYASHAENCGRAEGDYSHAEGNYTVAEGGYSHAEGDGTTASGQASHAQGFITTAAGSQSHAEGYMSQAMNSRSHAEGQGTMSQGVGSHSEGQYTAAVGLASHAEGLTTVDTPWYLATTSGLYDVIPMSETTMRAQYQWGGLKGTGLPEVGDLFWSSSDNIARVIAVNVDNEDLGNTYFVTNKPLRIVNGYARRVVCGALGDGSHTEGLNTVAASAYQHAQGKYNVEDSANKYAHIVGGGAKDSHSNIHTLEWTGKATYTGAVASSTGADYAEYFEWEDGNPNNEDRVGLLVTIQGEKIRLANMGEEILGVVSGTAAVIGDTAEWEWQEKYLKDKFGRVIWEPVEQFIEQYNDETGETEAISVGFMPQRKLNPNYNPEQEYVPRAERKEWDTIGMLGKLHVIDDGSCEVGGYATVGLNGKAMNSFTKTNMYVMKRIDETTILILLK